MANPILHIKDSYYFELPKFLWPAHYQSLDELPSYLGFVKKDAEAHHASIADVNRELSGKIVIPQPFGTLSSFYTKESGFAISKFMVLEVVIAVVMIAIFTNLAPKIGTGRAPKGYFWNFFEVLLLFIRDEVVRPSIDGHDDHDEHFPTHLAHESEHHVAVHKHEGDRFLPILWTMFFFILFGNLFGMLPWLGSPTAVLSVTAALAVCIFATTLISGSLKFGVVGFWKNQVPAMDLPGPMAVILKPMIFVIEVLGLFIKHGVLAIRLLANMLAGHMVLLSILGLILMVAEAGAASWLYGTVSFFSILGSTLLSVLELFVAFLQAYVFTFLSALFIGAAVHHH